MDNVATLLLVIGITCLIFGLRNLFSYLLFQYKAKTRLAWLETRGKVTGRVIEPEEVFSPRGGPVTRYYVAVQYTYQVQGAEYPGMLSLNQVYKSEEEAKQASEAYPDGSPLPVRYDPKHAQHHLDKEEAGNPPSLRTALILLAAGLTSVSLGIVFTD